MVAFGREFGGAHEATEFHRRHFSFPASFSRGVANMFLQRNPNGLFRTVAVRYVDVLVAELKRIVDELGRLLIIFQLRDAQAEQRQQQAIR